MVGRFTILGAFAPQSIVVFDKGEGEEKKVGGNATWIPSTKTLYVIYLTVKNLFLWVMCKLASKRTEVVKSSCSEGVARDASVTGGIVRVSKLHFP